jgi:nicotinamidase-related amidase
MSAPTLVVIDVQRAFDEPGWGERNNPGAEAKVAEALAGWRAQGAPVIHVRHESAEPGGTFVRGTTAFEFKPEAEPLEGEPVLTKNVNSGFIGTDLEERLRSAGAPAVALVGLTTDHCCSTTARMAANLGFETWVLGDAMATFDRRAPDGELISAALMHRTALASLHEEFAEVLDTSAALERLVSARD